VCLVGHLPPQGFSSGVSTFPQAGKNSSTDSSPLLWQQYAAHIDLYKFYIDSVIKLCVFHYAVTGAILSFYFTNANISLAKWALLLPAVLSAGLAVVFGRGPKLLDVLATDVVRLSQNLGLMVIPDFNVLRWVLWIFATIDGMTALATLGLVLLR
jgi:hypothetical protein